MISNRTLYSIRDEDGEKTTITLNKLVADILQKTLPDVHAWIQSAYDRVTKKKPKISRRQKGNLVRLLSVKEAEKAPRYNETMRNLLGL